MTDATKDGGPAFPGQWVHSDGQVESWLGMTMRDYFATAAMQAAATNEIGAAGFTFSERAAWAYQQADAMLKERAK